MQNRRDGRVVRDHTVAASRVSLRVRRMRPIHQGLIERGRCFAGLSGLAGLFLAGDPGGGKLLSNSRLPICGLNPLGSTCGADHRKGSMASRRAGHSDSQTVQTVSQTAVLALLRDSQTCPVTTGNSPEHRSPILHLSHPIARWDVLDVLCTVPHPPTPSQVTPGTTYPHARSLTLTLTHSHSLTVSASLPPAAQRPRRTRCGAPSHHTPTCQKGPLSRDFISVLTHPCPGPQENAPWPALNVRPAPARAVPPCPSEPLLEFFSQE